MDNPGCVLLNMDCIEFLEGLDDKSVDLVLTAAALDASENLLKRAVHQDKQPRRFHVAQQGVVER